MSRPSSEGRPSSVLSQCEENDEIEKPHPPLWEFGILGIFLILFFLQAISSAHLKSLTTDEYPHTAAAASYVFKNHYAINPEHPPLSKLISGFCVAALGPSVPELPNMDSKGINNQYARKFLMANKQKERWIAISLRLPHIILGCVLGCALWWVIREMYGRVAAIGAIFFYSTDPNVLAHTRLLTTDTGASLFVLLTILSLLNVLRRPSSWMRSLLFATFLGLALLTKFSCLFLIVLVPFLVSTWYLMIWLRGRGSRTLWRADRTPAEAGRKFFQMAISVVVVLPVLFLVLYRGSPEWYLVGAEKVWRHNQAGHTSFLLGEWRQTGWWYYFPTVMFVKTPLPLMILAASGVILYWRRRFSNRAEEIIVLVTPVVWLAASMTSSINLGIRHILPLYIFLFFIVGKAIQDLLARSRIARLLLIILVFWHVRIAAGTYPNYLSYFNEIAGGPDRGDRILVDSNLDWGQELISLKCWMEKNGVSSVVCPKTFFLLPELYGISVIPMELARPSPERPVYLAIGDTYRAMMLGGGTLRRFDEGSRHRFREFLRNQEVVADFGHSLTVYRVTERFPVVSKEEIRPGEVG